MGIKNASVIGSHSASAHYRFRCRSFIATHAPGGSLASLAGAANGFGIHSPGGYTMEAAFLAEMFLTMLLVFTVLAVTDEELQAGLPVFRSD